MMMIKDGLMCKQLLLLKIFFRTSVKIPAKQDRLSETGDMEIHRLERRP